MGTGGRGWGGKKSGLWLGYDVCVDGGLLRSVTSPAQRTHRTTQVYSWCKAREGEAPAEPERARYPVRGTVASVRREAFPGQLRMWNCVNLGVFQLFCQRLLWLRGRVLSVGRRPLIYRGLGRCPRCSTHLETLVMAVGAHARTDEKGCR